MAVWQENLKRLLKQKEVLILHGNVRDSAYVKKSGDAVPGLTPLLCEVGRALGYQRAVLWGVFFDHQSKGHTPMWSLERVEWLQGGGALEEQSASSEQGPASDAHAARVLTRWLKKDVNDVSQRTLFVINYIDKLTPYGQRGVYPKEIGVLITLVEKIIENIAANNRLILIALQDTMVPPDYYTQSPRVAIMGIPLPDKTERTLYFARHLGGQDLPGKKLDFLANITDGLYVRDLENVLRDVVAAAREQTEDLSQAELRRLVNRYRIGSEEDPWVRLPLNEPPKGLIDAAEAWFRERVVGQDEAVSSLVTAIKKARAGVVGLATGQESKPKATFFFAGPTGVGKTFLAKKLAEYLFDTDEAFVRFDMSEFKEEHTVSKLIGAPPGYVGFEIGGALTNAVKDRPFSVILFDEIEKAHLKIMDIFLQILDDGRLTDSRGQTVFFSESVIIFTSNLGTRSTDSAGRPSAEKQQLESALAVRDPTQRAARLREHFAAAVREFFVYEISRAELLNRIGSHIIAFNYIDDARSTERMITAKLRDIESNFRDKFTHLGHRLSFSAGVVEYLLARHGAEVARYGGRGLVNAIDDELGHVLADQILMAELRGLTGVNFVVDTQERERLLCHRAS